MAKKEEMHVVSGIKKVFTLRGILALGFAGWAVSSLLTTFDMIPDTVPVFGGIDDVALLLLAYWVGRDVIGWVLEKLGLSKDT